MAGVFGMWWTYRRFLWIYLRDFPVFNKLWREFMVFEDGWMPTRTTVQVAALPLKEIFVELKCVAVLDKE